ncbi:MAG TPA: allophanate hydrolase [Trebonia sp.]|nr:allophanate hydrolase [Trebonia sp.]
MRLTLAPTAAPSGGPDLGGVLTLDGLARAYAAGASPAGVVRVVLARIAARGNDHAWISVRSAAELAAETEAVAARWPDPAARPALFGVPYAVKDNIDVAGLPTTAACPGYAYRPAADAPLVARLREAGAICVGKTNLDQFATGLSGTRSPYGACESPLLPGLISGGSSSGSAVAVAAGLVPFSIGTDTAGSGRVPAALCGITGLKPSRGLVSTLGTVPACASLDCPSVFATSVADASAVLAVIAAFEPGDPWSRPLPVPPSVPAASGPLRTGVPRDPEFYGDAAAAAAFAAVVRAVGDAAGRAGQPGQETGGGREGAALVRDISDFLLAGRLLYEGPWVAERLAAVGDFAAAHPDRLHPVTRAVLDSGRGYSAADAFAGLHRLAGLRAATRTVWESVDVLLVPTVPTTFTVEEMLADPVRRNSVLGHYTTFANLLDLCAIAIPAGFTAAGRPHGVTLLAPAGADGLLAGAAAWLERLLGARSQQAG